MCNNRGINNNIQFAVLALSIFLKHFHVRPIFYLKVSQVDVIVNSLVDFCHSDIWEDTTHKVILRLIFKIFVLKPIIVTLCVRFVTIFSI